MDFHTIYIVYNKDEDPVITGTAKECAQYLDMTFDSFYCLVTRKKNHQIKGMKYLAYKIDI